DHLVGLSCSGDEEISREEYDTKIANPLREVFQARRWWTLRSTADHKQTVSATLVHFVAVIKGVPLKIRPAEKYPGDVAGPGPIRSEEHTSELQSRGHLVCRLLLEKKKKK